MNTIRPAIFLAALAGLSGCASQPVPACLPGEQPTILERLYFGTDSPGGAVGPEEWKLFLDKEVTPRFPQGLTTWDAKGQWRNAGGVIQPETSHILHIVHPDDPDSEASLRALIDLYKSTFRQESVLRVRSEVCASF